jgi:hypothetical protein
MKKINEEFLHFLWKNQQLTGVQLTSPGRSVRVLDPGTHNHDAGPDFFNAKVEIDHTLWAGNVEIHINASDWIRHGHTDDPSYRSVILHVVCFNDCEISRPDGGTIPVAMLRFPGLMWDRYDRLMRSDQWIPCQEKLKDIPPLYVAQWTSSLMVQKLQEKTSLLKKNMDDLQGHWDAILSRLLFRSFGIPVNTTPFEMLSLAVPYTMLLRNKNDLFSLEAILFGQAGMLTIVLSHDKYTEGMVQEYSRFAGRLKHGPIPGHAWKFMRMRPSSFPSLRIAQLAALISQRFPMHRHLETWPGIKELTDLFRIRAGDYWTSHYQLGKESVSSVKIPGREFIRSLIINCIVPYAFFFGKINKKQNFCDYAIGLLEQLPAENNRILKKWNSHGIGSSNAFDSQALLYLYKKYCTEKRCLDCQFGNNVLLDQRSVKL